jgi:hypothetical protein
MNRCILDVRTHSLCISLAISILKSNTILRASCFDMVTLGQNTPLLPKMCHRTSFQAGESPSMHVSCAFKNQCRMNFVTSCAYKF